MKLYEILLTNTDTGEFLMEETETLTFAEAARVAYILRAKCGYEWEVTSVWRTEKDV